METYHNVEGCVDNYRTIRPAYYRYACKEVAPGMFDVFYHADFVESEWWENVPFDRLLIDIHNHIMKYKIEMSEGV